MGLFDRVVGNALGSMSRSAGHAIGDAVGNAVGNMVGENINSVTTDIKIQNEEKMVNAKIQNEEKMMELAEKQKIEDLPPTCPHCGAATTKQLVCEYCHCKVVQ